MGYYDFPHTRNYDSDLAFLISRYKELIEEVKGIETDILRQAKGYTDEKIKRLAVQMTETVNRLNREYQQFTAIVNANLTLFDSELKRIEDKTEQEIIGVNARTDLAIAQNNEYIKRYIAEQVIDVKVVNYFTGETVTVQSMFDYLAQFHLDNAISYLQLFNKDKTYNEIIAYNASYTDLAINGGTIIQ